MIFLTAILVLTFLLYPIHPRFIKRVNVIGLAAIAYAYFADFMPGPFRGPPKDLDYIVANQYLGLDGMLGTPLQVAATFIILFTIYGAILDYTGAGKFYVDLGLGRRDDRHARIHRLPDAEEGGTRPGIERGDPVGRRDRRGHLTSGAGTGGVPHGRDPRYQLPAGRGHGDDADDPLLPRDTPHDRDRCAPARRARHRARCAWLLGPHEALLVPVHVALRDHRLPHRGLLDHHRGVLVDRRRDTGLLHPARDLSRPEQAREGARGRDEAGPAHRCDNSGRRHRGRYPPADGPRPQDLEPHPCPWLREPRGDAHRFGSRALGARSVAADHRHVSGRGAHGRPGVDHARRRAARRAHVRLLLRRALRGIAAGRAVAVRRGGDHRWQSVQDDDAHLEIRAALLPRPLHVHAAGRPRDPLDRIEHPGSGPRVGLGCGRDHRARGRRRRLPVAADQPGRARLSYRGRSAAAGSRARRGHRRARPLWDGRRVAALPPRAPARDRRRRLETTGVRPPRAPRPASLP